MPRSTKERAPLRANLTTGDVNVEADQYAAGTLKERRWDTQATNLTLPAGAYSIHVRHVDPAGGTITVNGEDIQFNGFFSRSSREDLVNKRQDLTPEILIQNPDGRKVSISVSYPSSSTVNPALL